MKFKIDFNKANYNNDKLLIELGAYYVPTGSDKYPPFEELEIEVEDFDKLKDIIEFIDRELKTYSSAVISFDPPSIFIDTY
jgi:hypothetical protein